MQEYYCGESYVPLSSIPTWKMEQLYNSKLNRDKSGLSSEEKDKIETNVLKNFEADWSIDLSEKVIK